MKYIAFNAIINIGSKHLTENLTVSECNMPVGCTSNSATPIFCEEDGNIEGAANITSTSNNTATKALQSLVFIA